MYRYLAVVLVGRCRWVSASGPRSAPRAIVSCIVSVSVATRGDARPCCELMYFYLLSFYHWSFRFTFYLFIL